MKEIAKKLNEYAAEIANNHVPAEEVAKNLEELARQIRKAAKAAAKKYHVKVLENFKDGRAPKEYDYKGTLKDIKEMIILEGFRGDYNRTYTDRNFQEDYDSITTVEEAIAMAQRVNDLLGRVGISRDTYKYIVL
jgi:hypothetical protein